MKNRPYIIACSVFGGRSPKTGKRVGTRHRWENDRCIFCFKTRDQVLERKASA